MEILENLNEKQDHTVILITHETSVAKCAKRIIRVQDGRISSDHKVNHRHNSQNGLYK